MFIHIVDPCSSYSYSTLPQNEIGNYSGTCSGAGLGLLSHSLGFVFGGGR